MSGGDGVSRPCAVRRCRGQATQAFDVRPAWRANSHEETRHYELCDEHADTYFPCGAGFLEKTVAETIRSDLNATRAEATA